MKSVKNQYIDLIEGKMSQKDFMRNLRSTLPQYITNITSFNDSLKILKNKGILTEAECQCHIKENKINQPEYKWWVYSNEQNKIISGWEYREDAMDNLKEMGETLGLLNVYGRDGLSKKGLNPDNDEDWGTDRALNENKLPSGKEQYSHFNEIDNFNAEEVFKGMSIEMNDNKKTKEEATRAIIKNLKKDPQYYTNCQISGVKGYKPKMMGSLKPDTYQMKEVGKDNLVDKHQGMKPAPNSSKPKASSNKQSKETVSPVKGIKLMSLVAQSTRGVKKMDPTGEKMKKIRLRENVEHINWDAISEKDAQSLFDYVERTGRFPFDLTPQKYEEITSKYDLISQENIRENYDSYRKPLDRIAVIDGYVQVDDTVYFKGDKYVVKEISADSDGKRFIYAEDPTDDSKYVRARALNFRIENITPDE